MKKLSCFPALVVLFLFCSIVHADDKIIVLPLGTGPDIGRQDITPGPSDQTITRGYHDGTGIVAGDADLVSGNIRSGVSIFGVTGDYVFPGSLLECSGHVINPQINPGYCGDCNTKCGVYEYCNNGVCACDATRDSDGDGIPDCNDLCLDDPNKPAPGECGCGVADIDTDNDGIFDCNDDSWCGNGTLNAADGEECDDGGQSAVCEADCRFPACGDGIVNQYAGEECDDMGESPSCDDDCTFSVCGDGSVNTVAGEECDGANLNGMICLGLTGYLGTLSCTGTCTFDTSYCLCGNGIVDLGEQCDNTELSGFNCVDLGYTSGTLSCDPSSCTFDASGCSLTGTCGNGIVEPGEDCEIGDMGPSCQALGMGPATFSLPCNSIDCTWDVSLCTP